MNPTTGRCRQRLVGLIQCLFVACWIAVLRAAGGETPVFEADFTRVETGVAIQHTPLTLTFTAARDLAWRSFPVQAVFTQGTRRIELDAFWDGGRSWQVRFAAPTAGEWRYEVKSAGAGLEGQAGLLHVTAPGAAQVQSNVNLRGPVRAVGHHFSYADGTPVLLLGDCLLISGLGIENGEFIAALEHRRASGFNALNVRLCKRGSTNEGGAVYETATGVDGLNPRHFQSIDRRLQAAWERGFVTFFMPDFLGFGGYTQSEVQDLWRYLLARYAAFNVCPIVTGEYDNPRRLAPYWKDRERWNEVGRFIRGLNQRGLRVPVGTHPVNSSSGAAFHDQPWLDYNQIQAKVWREFDTLPVSLLEDLAREPAKPSFYAEGTYENQPWGGITGTALHVRHQTWVAYLCGAAAVDYGEHRLKGGNLNGEPIAPLLEMPGARQAGLAANFLRGLAWWRMSPQRESVRVDGVVAPLASRKANTVTAYCLAEPQQRYVVYLMAGLENRRVTVAGLGRHRYTAQWIDPRTMKPAGQPMATSGETNWDLPARPQPPNEDWALMLERTHSSEP